MPFSHLHFLVAGDVMLDEYVFGDAERLSPEAPVPVLHVKKRSWSLGGAGNVALQLAKLGAKVTLLGARGDDPAGRRLDTLAEENSIDAALVEAGNKPTIVKTRYVAGKHQLLRTDLEEPFEEEESALALAKSMGESQAFHAVLISDYGKGFCSGALCRFLIERYGQQNIPVIIDPKGTAWSKYAGAFLVTPNLREFEAVAGTKLANDDAEVEMHLETVRQKYNLSNLLVTRSDRGMSLLAGTTTTHLPARALDVFDVTGAGDTVLSVLTAFYSLTGNLEQACHVANLAAGYAVSKFGAYCLDKEELSVLVEKEYRPEAFTTARRIEN
jgi:D-beta-D-heptose 7-phosphate kinase/D-beta-D-heptose 1-phosphate adenosyltransferase